MNQCLIMFEHFRSVQIEQIGEPETETGTTSMMADDVDESVELGCSSPKTLGSSEKSILVS
ncbi:hypothetical protein Hanom_Chr10g00918301 [Helianthus anomalus]